jgi:hypothetical protein
MKRKMHISYLLRLSLALSIPGLLGSHFAWAGELNGFSIHTRDKAVTVTLFSDQSLPFTTQRQDKQLTIILPDTKLSKHLIDDGLPVVIDDQNRFIGRAVPGADGNIKIILPNLPAEGYSISIRQQRSTTPSNSAANASTTANTASTPQTVTRHATEHTPKPEQASTAITTPSLSQQSTNTVLKPRSAVKTNGKQAFDQMLAKLPIATGTKHSPLSSKPAEQNILPPKAVMERFNAPSPMMLSTVESNNGNDHRTQPGTIWNPYVIKVNPAPKQSIPKSQVEEAENSIRLYSAASQPIQTTPSDDPYAQLHTLANSPGFKLPAPPVFPTSAALPSTFHASLPLPPIETPTSLKTAETVSSQNSANSAASVPNKMVSSGRITATTHVAEASPWLRLLTSPTWPPIWLWIAMGLFLGGIGLFCLLGSALLGRILLMRNLNFFRPAASPSSLVDSATSETSAPHPAKRRPVRTGLGIQDTAIVNALDYMGQSTPNMAEVLRNNPFRERFAARSHVKPKKDEIPSLSR